MKTIRLLKGLLLGIFLLGSAGILIAGGIVLLIRIRRE